MVDRRLWSQSHLTIAVQGPEGETRYSTKRPFAIIGSLPTADVVLEGPKRMYYLHACEAGVYCLNLTDPNAPHNPCNSPGDGWLCQEDFLVVGSHKISVICPELPASDVSPSFAPQHAAPLLRISTAQNGSLADRRLSSMLTIVGRTKPSRVRIRCASLSKCHCVFYRQGERLWVVDLLSGNRVAMDGEFVSAAHVEQGSTVTIGDIRATFVGFEDASVESSEKDDLAGGSATDLACRASQPDAKNLALQTDAVDDRQMAEHLARFENVLAELRSSQIRLRQQQLRWEKQRQQSEAEFLRRIKELDEEADRIASQRQELREEQAIWRDELRARQQELSAKIEEIKSSQGVREHDETAALGQAASEKSILSPSQSWRIEPQQIEHKQTGSDWVSMPVKADPRSAPLRSDSCEDLKDREEPAKNELSDFVMGGLQQLHSKRKRRVFFYGGLIAAVALLLAALTATTWQLLSPANERLDGATLQQEELLPSLPWKKSS